MVALAAAATVLLVGAPAAHAENTVVSSDPEAGAVLANSPSAVSITFAEAIGSANTISLSCAAEFVEVPEPEVSDDRLTLSVTITDPLPKGTCVAAWAVSDQRGEANGTGNLTFSIQNEPVAAPVDPGATPGTDGDGTGETTPAPTIPAPTGDADDTAVGSLSNATSERGPLWLGRLISVGGLAVFFGSLVLLAACWPEGVEYLLTIRFVRAAWFFALGGTFLYTAAATAAVTGGSLGSGFNPSGWLDLADAGGPGRAALARMILVVVSGWVAFRPDRVILPTTQLAGLGIPALAVATIGFSRTDGPSFLLGAAAGVTHALAMAIWVGGTVMLMRVVLAGSGEEDLVHAVRGFGRISMVAIVVTIGTGVVQMLRLDSGSLFGSSHGRVVVLKAVLVAAMVFIGITARQVANQRLHRASELTPGNAARLRRAFSSEAGIGIVTLAVSAWLLALTPPGVDTTPRIPYALAFSVQVEEVDLDVSVKLTRSTVGRTGLEVTVISPEEGLSGLEVVFENAERGQIVQPIPLTGEGTAVRYEGPTSGLPIDVPGTWTVVVNATTAAGPVSSPPQAFTITALDGTVPETVLTTPPTSLVTQPTTTAAP